MSELKEIYDFSFNVHKVPAVKVEFKQFPFLDAFVHPALVVQHDGTVKPDSSVGYAVSEASTGTSLSGRGVAFKTQREAVQATAKRLKEIGVEKVRGRVPRVQKMLFQKGQPLLNGHINDTNPIPF